MNVRSNMELTPERCEVECLRPEHVRPLLGKVIGSDDADAVVGTFELLADATRARILHALALTRELCVCDLALLLGLSQSAISHQLRSLRDRRAVRRRRSGRVVYYALADAHVRGLLREGVTHAREGSAHLRRAASGRR